MGLVFGSFFNVVIWRLPRKLSIVSPGSQCPSCGKSLAIFELVPVISFLWQKGRCRQCGGRISIRYPVIELLTGVLFFFAARTASSPMEAVSGSIFLSLLLILALIDLEYYLLPNVLTVLGTATGLLLALASASISLQQSFLGLIAGGGVVLLIFVLSRGGMGFGDVKMMAMIGAFLGPESSMITLVVASVIGSVIGLVYLKVTGKDKKTPLPFGTFLSIAATLVYFFY